MKIIKIIGSILAILLIFPLLFGIVISIQAGCALCLEGGLAGTLQERALNIALLLIICLLVFLGLKYFRR